MRKRLYTLGADIGYGRGYRRPPLLNGVPHTGDGAFVRLYVFAATSLEARQHAEERLRRDRYRVLELSGVQPNGSK